MHSAATVGPRVETQHRLGWGTSRFVSLRTSAAFLLAGLSGLLYAASFPPLAWSWAAWFALVPLLASAATLTPLRAAAAGMIWTAAMAVGVAWWLPGMLSRYFGLPVALSWVGALVVIVALAGVYVSAYAAWVAWLVRCRAASPLLLAGGWLAVEFARAHGVIGNPWALSAYSQVRATALIQIADLAGPYGIGVVIAAVNASVAALVVPALRGRHFAVHLAVVAAALCGVLLYGQWRLGETFGDGAPVAVAVVQDGTPTSPSGQTALRAARLARYVELTKGLGDRRPALIVWPEYAVESYLQEASAARDAVLAVAAETRADLILGGPHYAPGATGTRYHNSVFLVRDGRLAARYDKNRLVPFAEDDRLEWLVGHKPVRYTAGRGGFVLSSTALRVGAFLCLESMYPQVIREVAEQGAEVLANLSNDSWFGQPDAMRQQLDSAALRAVENRRYLVRATSTGFSAVVDPHGHIVVQSELDTPQVLATTVRGSHTRTPYQRCGDAFAWAVIASVSGATLLQRIQRLRHQPISREGAMKHTPILTAFALVIAVGAAGPARAGAPTPDIRENDFAHVCKGGSNKDQPCTVANAAIDCPKSECVPKTLSKTIRGTLTIIAVDDVRDWAQGIGGNQALTLLLEVKAPDGTKQMLAASYQDLTFPTNPPQALSNVVTIDMNETNLAALAAQVSGLLFAQPESVMAQRLQALFTATGTPVIVEVNDKRVRFADHTADGLATVLRFKVKIQFIEPV